MGRGGIFIRTRWRRGGEGRLYGVGAHIPSALDSNFKIPTSRAKGAREMGHPEPSQRLQLLPGAEALAQIRFPEAALLLPGDRFILRQFSPVTTIGGGVVLDAAPMTDPKGVRKLEKAAGGSILAFTQKMEEFGSG